MNIKTILLLAIGILLFFAFMSYHAIYPIILTVWMFSSYYTLNNLEKKHNAKSISDFWLNQDQKEHFLSLNCEINKRHSEINRLHQEAIKQNISKNIDGSYSNKSQNGKNINEKLKENQKGLYEMEREFDELDRLPANKYELFKKELSNEYGIQFFTGVALICFLILLIVDFGIGAIIDKVNQHDFFRSLTNILFSIVIGGITYFITKNFYTHRIERVYPVPPEITMSNINSY